MDITPGQVVLYLVLIVLLIFVITALVKAVRIVPQAVALIVERLGRYHKTLEPGLHLLVPFIDKVRAGVDLREQVVSFPPQPVITSDNLVVSIDTVIYFSVTDPSRPSTRSRTTSPVSSSSPSPRCVTWSARWTWSRR